jgi:hypothetical protein
VDGYFGLYTKYLNHWVLNETHITFLFVCAMQAVEIQYHKEGHLT